MGADCEDENTDVKREVDIDRTIRTNNNAHNLKKEIATLLFWQGGVPLSSMQLMRRITLSHSPTPIELAQAPQQTNNDLSPCKIPSNEKQTNQA